MNQKKKAKYVGMAGALLVHAAVILLLLMVGFTVPKQQEEGGVPVMLGEAMQAEATLDPSLVEVDVLAEEAAPLDEVPLDEAVPDEAEQELLTQETEETVAIPPKQEKPEKKLPEKEPVKKEPKKDPKKEPKKEPKPQTEKQPQKVEKTEAEKAEEARKLAEAKAEKARREAEEAARRRVAGAFGKGAKMADKDRAEGTGMQGSPAGNATAGQAEGSGGYGSFDLGGRSLGEGGLPRPVYTVQDEGRVVVDITVNPSGRVIATGINRRTNTVNPALRKAAEDAARKARFNAVSGLNNQQGTITYYFNLK